MKASDTDSDPWDRYWHQGNLHSFSQVSEGNYGGAIARFWRDRFAGLADGECILDIASGNGAVALLALDVADAAGRTVAIHGTDLAAIDPARRLAGSAQREAARRIRFHPATPAEALPFAQGSVDRAASQFGLEYSDRSRSVPELARVLRSGGRLGLIVHHQASAAVRAATDEAAGIDAVLDEARLYLKTRNLLRALPRPRTPQPVEGAHLPAKAARKRAAVDRAIAAIEERARPSPEPRLLLGPMNYVREVLAMTPRIGPAPALEWLEEARRRCVTMRRRLAAMQAAACSAADIEGLARQLDAAGIETGGAAVLRDEAGAIVGWGITGRRR